MNKKKWSPSLIKDLVDNIQDEEGNRIIPIIGQGVYQVNDGGRKYTIQQFIIKTVLEDERIPLQPSDSIIEEYSNGYRGMTELSKLCSKYDLTLLRQVKEILEINKAERHIRGGIATKKKYEKQRGSKPTRPS